MGMKGTQTLVSTAVAPAEGSTPANPETAMARMEAVATMVAPVFLIRQGSRNCSASWWRGEGGFGGVACAECRLERGIGRLRTGGIGRRQCKHHGQRQNRTAGAKRDAAGLRTENGRGSSFLYEVDLGLPSALTLQ